MERTEKIGNFTIKKHGFFILKSDNIPILYLGLRGDFTPVNIIGFESVEL